MVLLALIRCLRPRGDVRRHAATVPFCGVSMSRFSSAKGKPADYFARSKLAVGRARKDWKELMDYLGM